MFVIMQAYRIKKKMFICEIKMFLNDIVFYHFCVY